MRALNLRHIGHCLWPSITLLYYLFFLLLHCDTSFLWSFNKVTQSRMLFLKKLHELAYLNETVDTLDIVCGPQLPTFSVCFCFCIITHLSLSFSLSESVFPFHFSIRNEVKIPPILLALTFAAKSVY